MAETNPSHWRPMLWPEEWTSPNTVSLVAGSAIDCIILPQPGAKWQQVEAEARRAGLSALAGIPSAVRVIEDGVWPKVARSKGDADAADAGPTGLPWLDSNGWRIQLARARFPGAAPWVRFPSPGEGNVMPPGAYAVAVADCEAYGGRWAVSLDGPLARGVAARNSAAVKSWQRLLQTAAFFRNQPPAPEMHPAGILGAISDFAGQNELLGDEFLNLIAREYVPVRILLKNGAPSLDGLRMAVYLDREPIPPAWKRALTQFVQNGGTLMTGVSADPALGRRSASIPGLEYNIRTYGRGRVAVAQQEFDDPWRVAGDAHVLLGRANDLVRQANAGSMNICFTALPDGKRARLHLVNYAAQPGLNPVTLTFLHAYRSARFQSLEQPKPANLPVHREYERSAVYLPQFSICATLDLEV